MLKKITGIKLPDLGKKKKIIIGVVSGVLILLIIFGILAKTGVIPVFNKNNKAGQIQFGNDDRVTRGDVEVVITGSAAIEPNERFEIISMVSGDIIRSDYDVGDSVNEGDILYQFDTSATDISMQKQRLSLEQSEMNYNNAMKKKDDLVVTAPCNGVISGLDLEEDDDISQGTYVADVNNSKVMKVILPFNDSQISGISKGDIAEITSSVNMASMSGVVTAVASVATAQADGSKLYDVTINFDNPGAINAGQTVGGAINGMISPGSGTVAYSETGKVTSSAEGTVSRVYHKNGDYVNKGDTILVISSDSITDSVKSSSISYKNAQLTLKEQEEKLDDYSIKSPISGTVITKNSKAGDTIDKTNSNTVLMVVADVSKLKFSLAIDELDVSKVTEGQEVEITCDALPDELYYGTIQTVSVEGTATNGVTTYSAEVIIDEPGDLRPSMNIDASVIIEKAENVLRIPTSDIKTAMGRSFVFVKDNGDSKDNISGEMPGMNGKRPEGIPPMGENGKRPEGIPPMGENGERPEGVPPMGEGKERPEGIPSKGEDKAQDGEKTDKDSGVKAPEGKTDKATGNKRPAGMMPQAPEGYRTVEIVIGVSGEEFTEVKSGLAEGDLVYSQTVSASGNNVFGQMGRNGMSGGMSMGGMSGGMPMGGGMSGNRMGGMPMGR